MKLAVVEALSISLILLAIVPNGYCAPTNNQERSLAENYSALTDDVKWFFRGISKFAGVLEKVLPNVTTDLVNTRSFSENTRISLLIGLRHLLVGVREISITFEQSFNTDHIKQLHQLRHVSDFINQLITVMNMWFSQMRSLAMHLLHLYNRYIPEVLFGKCLGSYLVKNYPERSYYEYPFILLTDIYTSIVASNDYPTENSTESPNPNSDINMEQNEISHADFDDYKTTFGARLPRQAEDNYTESSADTESIFDLTTVLNENKDEIIESAGNRQSWQICVKLYTAESISRSLKIYFLGL